MIFRIHRPFTIVVGVFLTLMGIVFLSYRIIGAPITELDKELSASLVILAIGIFEILSGLGKRFTLQ